MDKAKIGLIGLAVMGQNLARNLADKGHRVSVYNRTGKVTEDFLLDYANENLIGRLDLEAFVESLESPRKIWLMVKAGPAVDSVIESLLPFLNKGDTIIDGGNTHYPDTMRREKYLKAKGIYFFGCGVSGGEEGALHGPSLMPGGNAKVWEDLRPMLEDIAARDFQEGACVSYLGANGAGHFVKMVHNGIEYAVMQMMAEAYGFLSGVYHLSAPEIGDIFAEFNKGKLASYLFEIATPVLKKEDKLAEGYLVDQILDRAGQKGTGRWTAVEGLDQGVDVSTISGAVFARVVSSQKEERERLASEYFKPESVVHLPPLSEFVPQLENALYVGMMMAYAQGFRLMEQAGSEYKWKFEFNEIARIWQGGCIIRAQMLRTLHDAFLHSRETNLLMIPSLREEISEAWPDLRAVVSFGVQLGVPLFALGNGLTHLESMTEPRGSANFVQGLRDFFGAHRYERTDRKGSFHADWEG